MNQRDINYRTNLRYQEGQNEYIVSIRKRNWWWLLLLLLLLLLVRCERTIKVHVQEEATGYAVEDVDVNLDYTAHFLYKDGFFKNEPIARVEKTDSTGTAVFEHLPCSVYSYIFYALAKVKASCETECYEKAQETALFHWTWNMTLKLKPVLKDLFVLVVDDETSDPLVDATVTYSYLNIRGEAAVDSVKTKPEGIATIKDFPLCGVIDELRGSCYGYADTTKVNVPAKDLLTISDLSTLRLRPIKEKIIFFVKDVETKEPVVNALATVTLTDRSSRKVRSSGRTSVDGKGVGFYDDAFILAKVDIEAQHPNYYDSVFVGDYTVEQFVKLPDDKRIVWMRPKPLKVDFQNVDSITGKGIPGVTNHITITDPAGNTTVVSPDPISGTNGFFPVVAKVGSKIEIHSSKPTDYADKDTIIVDFSKGEKIHMRPLLVDLEFKTVYRHNQNELCPDCGLEIRTASGVIGTPIPSNSGSGVFMVNGLQPHDRLFIYATKDDEVNNTKVNGVDVEYLKTHSDARNIPMSLRYKYSSPLPFAIPTQVGELDMVGSTSNRVLLEWTQLCTACTTIQICDDKGNLIDEVGYMTSYNAPAGVKIMTSPTSKIIIKVRDENAHQLDFVVTAL